jgi:hypothetical protein
LGASSPRRDPHVLTPRVAGFDSFPWVTTAEITDDIDASVARAILAWDETPFARLGVAIT